MAVSALSAARSLCQMRDWRVSNLELQKILYIAHMFHLGTTNQPLVRENFEAWDYGPVLPELYARARGFGSGPVRNVFHWEPDVPEGTSEWRMLADAEKATRGMKPSQLVAITHWDRGAWYSSYRSGEKHIVIPDDLILEEYRAREAQKAKATANA